MNHHIIFTALVAALHLAQPSSAQATTTTVVADPALVGTWSSKSNTVMTGPDFYDPVKEQLKEPRLPGISFSFTADGKFEEAQYVVISNPTKPECPSAMLLWQHGSYTLNSNGSLSLHPIHVDGRQLLSDPCEADESTYMRWSQTELYKGYEVLDDTYKKVRRLNLYKFDGAPVNPMYIAYEPPQMLPTTTLNPTAVPASTEAGKRRRVKRELVKGWKKASELNPDSWLWVGLGLTAAGLVGCLAV